MQLSSIPTSIRTTPTTSSTPATDDALGVDIVIVRVPRTPDGIESRDHGHGLRGRSLPGRPTDSQALADARKAVDEVVGYYRSIGVTAAEGAEKIHVEFDPSYPNAHYDLIADEMVIGVDPRSGRSFADSKDVVAHELGHRIAMRTGAIDLHGANQGENAAVQEHVADVFSAAFDKDDWTLGEDLGRPVRDLANPGRLGHPSTVADVERGIRDGSLLVPARTRDGRVVQVPNWHDVAEVPNRAASMIGDAIGRDDMAKLYLETLRNRAEPGMSMSEFAKAVTLTAKDMYGARSSQLRATLDAWQAVGLLKLQSRS